MWRNVRLVLAVLCGLAMLALIVLLLSPAGRRLAPTWLYYDLVVRQIGTLPPGAEQFVLAQGQAFCSIGRDSECGGYKLVNVRSLALGQVARAQGTAAAWCVDYVVLRRNTGRRSRALIFWANIPRSMIVAEQSGGQYEALPTQGCAMATL